MTEKQKIFADEYIKEPNASRAYLKAYPRVKSSDVARRCGSRLLTYADVRAYIDEELEKLHSVRVADAQEILEYLTQVIRGETVSTAVVVEGTGEGFSRARTLDKAPDERERLKAAELLGKRYGIYSDKVDIAGAVPVVVSGDADLTD